MVRHHTLRHWLFFGFGFVLLIGCTVRPSGSTAEAPIIIDVRATYCELSVHGTYAAVYHEAGFTLYQLDTATEAITIPPHGRIGGLWLDDSTWFEYTVQELVGSTYQPTDGWIIDLNRGTITDIMTLNTVQRNQTFHDVKTLLSNPARSEAAQVSPDGRYRAVSSTIYETMGPRIGQVNNEFHTSRTTSGCRFGWKADSSGFYFIEHGDGFGNPPGPIRFLPVTP